MIKKCPNCGLNHRKDSFVMKCLKMIQNHVGYKHLGGQEITAEEQSELNVMKEYAKRFGYKEQEYD